MRRGTLAAIALVAGCLQPASHECSGDQGQHWACPEKLACAQAPVYCGVPEQVAHCAGLGEWASCEYVKGDKTSGSCRGGVCEMCTSDREGCAGPNKGWFSMTSPGAANLSAVTVPKQGQAFAAGASGTLIGYDGTRWQPIVTVPALPGDLGSVWASGSDDVYVVSSVTEHNVMHVAGGTWTDVAMPATAGVITAIDGTAANDIHAVGTRGTIVDFDGTTWSLAQGSGGPTYKAVHAIAPGSAVAVANGGGYLASETGGAWTVSQPIDPNTVAAAIWRGTGETVVVGGAPTTGQPPALDYYATSWTQPTLQPASEVLGRNLNGVLGTPQAIYAVGQRGLIIESADRVSWNAVSTPLTESDLEAIAASSPTDLFIVGYGGVILRSLGD